MVLNQTKMKIFSWLILSLNRCIWSDVIQYNMTLWNAMGWMVESCIQPKTMIYLLPCLWAPQRKFLFLSMLLENLIAHSSIVCLFASISRSFLQQSLLTSSFVSAGTLDSLMVSVYLPDIFPLNRGWWSSAFVGDRAVWKQCSREFI